MGLVRQNVVFTLVVTLLLTGMPFPAHAATGEEAPPLMLNGRPLAELLRGRATGAPIPVPSQRQQDGGQISGVLLDADRQSLADRRVELSRPARDGEGLLVAMTDADGAFSYTGLGPSRYEVLYQVGGEVRARSGPIHLAASAMQVSGVSIAVSPRNRDRIATGVARSFEQLVVLVRPGDTVSVIDTMGTEVSGRLERVSAGSLELLTDDGPREWLEGDVRTIRQRGGDSRMNGALMGLGVGAAFGVVLVARACSFFRCKGAFLPLGAVGVGIWSGMGAAVGTGIDGLITTRHVIYDSAESPNLSLTPLVTRT